MTGEAERRVLVGADWAGQRLDKVLALALADMSRARLQALIAEGAVTIDGRLAGNASEKVVAGAVLAVVLPPPAAALPQGEAIRLTVVHEDAHLIVIDKPAGIVVHPAAGHATGTLVNALIAHCGDSLSGIGGVKRPGIVHRLDKDTSGLLVVAKTDAAHRALAAQFAAHGADGQLQRRYMALSWGDPGRAQGVVDAPLARSTQNRLKIAVTAGGRRAVTHWRAAARFRAGDDVLVSQLDLDLETGRTHQIRVHMAHIGHPLLGDAVYGAGFATRARRLGSLSAAALQSLGRQALHAAVLGFVHPATGRPLRFESPWPAEIALVVQALGQEHGARTGGTRALG
jgi:23S rRNA pseudouridine1911/1915/1917 synthase